MLDLMEQEDLNSFLIIFCFFVLIHKNFGEPTHSWMSLHNDITNDIFIADKWSWAEKWTTTARASKFQTSRGQPFDDMSPFNFHLHAVRFSSDPWPVRSHLLKDYFRNGPTCCTGCCAEVHELTRFPLFCGPRHEIVGYGQAEMLLALRRCGLLNVHFVSAQCSWGSTATVSSLSCLFFQLFEVFLCY